MESPEVDEDDGEAGASATVFECSVCSHPRVREINAAIEGGTSVRDVAGTFSLSRSAVGRHRLRHLSLEGVGADLAEAGIGARFEPVEVHARLSALAAQLDGLLKVNLRRPERATSLSNIARELRATLEAIGRLQADERLLAAASAQELRARFSGQFGEALIAFLAAAIADPLRQVLGPEACAAAWGQIRAMLETAGQGGQPADVGLSAAWETWLAAREEQKRAEDARFGAMVAGEAARQPRALPAGPSVGLAFR